MRLGMYARGENGGASLPFTSQSQRVDKGHLTYNVGQSIVRFTICAVISVYWYLTGVRACATIG